MTTQEAADFLGLSRNHVCYLIRKGYLPAERVGARLYVLREKDVQAYKKNPAELGNPNHDPQGRFSKC